MYIIVFITSVFISSVSQVLLKKSAELKYDGFWKEYLNFRVILAYSIFFISTILTIFAYRGVPLSMGPVLEATGYVWVTILGVLVLKEEVNKTKLIGVAMIILGGLVLAL